MNLKDERKECEEFDSISRDFDLTCDLRNL